MTMKQVLILLLCMISLLSTPTAACQFDDHDASPEKFFDLAATVFTAHITKTTEIDLPTSQEYAATTAIESEFKIVEVFKGTPPANQKVHDLVFGFGNCSTPLLAGTDYLFFLQSSEKENMPKWWNYVGLPTGSRMIYPIESKKITELLEKIRNHASLNKKSKE
jgi:hypothetical protein